MEQSGKPSGAAFETATGELYMLGKKERILLRAILDLALRSKAGRESIAERCGRESLQMATRLLHEMGGDSGR